MAKKPDTPKKPKDPARPTRSKANREQLPPIAPALADLLNPAIKRGEAGVGSQTGLQQPPDNSRDRRADAAAAHKARASTAQGFGEASQTGYVAKTPNTQPVVFDAELARAFGMPGDGPAQSDGAEEQAHGAQRQRRDDIEDSGVAATASALEQLLRQGRREFLRDDGTPQIWTRIGRRGPKRPRAVSAS